MSSEENKQKIQEALNTEDAFLSYGTLNDDDVLYLVECLKSNNITKELGLGNNKFGDAGVIALAEFLKGNSTIEKLSIAGNTLGANAFASLAVALKFCSLKSLNLDCTSSCPDDIAPCEYTENAINKFLDYFQGDSLETIVLSS